MKRQYSTCAESLLNLRGIAAQSQRNPCSISPVCLRNLGGVRKGRDDYLSFESDKGLFVVREIRSYDTHAFNLKHTPPKDANITFVKSRVFDDDDFDTEGLKFTYCDRHLYIFTEEDWLIITISISDILEEDDDTPEPGYEDSDLYLEKY